MTREKLGEYRGEFLIPPAEGWSAFGGNFQFLVFNSITAFKV
jgi:hypothetical protein